MGGRGMHTGRAREGIIQGEEGNAPFCCISPTPWQHQASRCIHATPPFSPLSLPTAWQHSCYRHCHATTTKSTRHHQPGRDARRAAHTHATAAAAAAVTAATAPPDSAASGTRRARCDTLRLCAVGLVQDDTLKLGLEPAGGCVDVCTPQPGTATWAAPTCLPACLQCRRCCCCSHHTTPRHTTQHDTTPHHTTPHSPLHGVLLCDAVLHAHAVVGAAAAGHAVPWALQHHIEVHACVV